MATPYLRSPETAPTLAVVGDIYRLLASGEDTNGRCVVIDAIIPPGGGPPPHTHTNEDEHFTILEGEVTFLSDGQTIVARPGDYLFAPRGHMHTFGNKSAKPARMLIHIAPAGIEHMFREFGHEVPPGTTTAVPPSPADIVRVIEICPRYGITLHGPKH